MADNNPFEQPPVTPLFGEPKSSKRPIWIIYVGIIAILCCLLVGVIGGGLKLLVSMAGDQKTISWTFK
jgi:hypothetical protein